MDLPPIRFLTSSVVKLNYLEQHNVSILVRNSSLSLLHSFFETNALIGVYGSRLSDMTIGAQHSSFLHLERLGNLSSGSYRGAFGVLVLYREAAKVTVDLSNIVANISISPWTGINQALEINNEANLIKIEEEIVPRTHSLHRLTLKVQRSLIMVTALTEANAMSIVGDVDHADVLVRDTTFHMSSRSKHLDARQGRTVSVFRSANHPLLLSAVHFVNVSVISVCGTTDKLGLYFLADVLLRVVDLFGLNQTTLTLHNVSAVTSVASMSVSTILLTVTSSVLEIGNLVQSSIAVGGSSLTTAYDFPLPLNGAGILYSVISALANVTDSNVELRCGFLHCAESSSYECNETCLPCQHSVFWGQACYDQHRFAWWGDSEAGACVTQQFVSCAEPRHL